MDRDSKGRFTKGNKCGGRKPLPKELTDEIRSSAPDAIATILSLMKNKKTSAGIRFACASYLLDRGYGKPANTMYYDSLENAELHDPAIELILHRWDVASGLVADDPKKQVDES